MKTTVINIRNAPSGFKKQDGVQAEKYVYIGRPGYFGNPVSKFGKCPVCNGYHKDNGSTLSCYRKYLEERCINSSDFKKAIMSLKDKTLVCYCKPGPCHGDIIIEYINSQG